MTRTRGRQIVAKPTPRSPGAGRLPLAYVAHRARFSRGRSRPCPSNSRLPARPSTSSTAAGLRSRPSRPRRPKRDPEADAGAAAPGGSVAVSSARSALGAGAWAALTFFQQGAQPAEALPSSTVAYVSIDLDPAGGQKIDAFRTLNKFPAFKDEVGVNSVDDIRRKVGESILEGADCTNLTYDHDIDPWLGERAAAAAVDVGADKPDLVVVVQVKDEAKASDGLHRAQRLRHRRGRRPASSSTTAGRSWRSRRRSPTRSSPATDQGTLADDATYQKWTKAVGDSGVVNAYASPAAGRVLAQQLSGLFEGTISSGPSFDDVEPDGDDRDRIRLRR